MPYYRLKKDLPTFKAGDLFYTDDYGSLCHFKDDIMAYHHTTIAKFPDMLKDWFEPAQAPIRDVKTRAAFEAYLMMNPEQRFFQAIRNFTRIYLNENVVCIEATGFGNNDEENFRDDTFDWECDEMLEEDDEIQS